MAGDDQIFDNIRILPGGNGGGVVGGLMRIARLRKAIKQADPDQIVCVGTFADLMVPLVAPNRKSLLTVHGNYTMLLGESKLAWILRPMLRWRFARSLVVAPAQGVADDLIKNFSATNVRVIHHGVDGEEITRLADAKPQDLPAEPYILAVGRLAKQKDYPTLLGAYAKAREKGLTFPLVIVGDGPERTEIESLAKQLGLTGQARFLGHRDNPYPYMKQARFLVLSSLWEGFGLVLIEAMALGIPCVSTDCPSGPGEILGHGEFGLLAPPADVDDLADKILQMCDPEARATFARAAIRRSADFSLRRMAMAYEQLLHI